jgi:hypothetical protein
VPLSIFVGAAVPVKEGAVAAHGPDGETRDRAVTAINAGSHGWFNLLPSRIVTTGESTT